MNIKKYLLQNKNFKLGYYIKVVLSNLIPNSIFRFRKDKLLTQIDAHELPAIEKRLHYYNALHHAFSIQNNPNVYRLANFKLTDISKVYYYDIKRYLKYFDPNFPFLYKPGDNIDTLTAPHFVKSRRVDHSPNEVLLKLNAVRHFNFIQDDNAFQDKQPILFGRLAVYQDIRKRFFTQFFNHPMCDLGDVAKGTVSNWLKPKESIAHHLKYKFILALEGNDVATNLKWIMSSNSIAVMPKPKYETWFMEGLLEPNVHYICIKDDFSDLDAQLSYYINNEEAALKIIDNAHKWVDQFNNAQNELTLHLLVMKKYFEMTK